MKQKRDECHVKREHDEQFYGTKSKHLDFLNDDIDNIYHRTCHYFDKNKIPYYLTLLCFHYCFCKTLAAPTFKMLVQKLRGKRRGVLDIYTITGLRGGI